MMQTETSTTKQRDDVGAMWSREGKNGTYFSIVINGEKYLAFANKFKKDERHPDFRIFPNTMASDSQKATNDGPPF